MKKFILLLVIGVFLAIAGSYFYLGMEERASKGPIIKEGMVKGSAIQANGQIYTLNYKQQEVLLKALNHAKKVYNPKRAPFTPEAVESLFIYQFDLQNPIELIPADDNFSLFQVKGWKEAEFLQLQEPEDLEITLELAYDK